MRRSRSRPLPCLASVARRRERRAAEGATHPAAAHAHPASVSGDRRRRHSPPLASDIGIHLKPLETEAVTVSVLFFLGINYGWLLFTEPAHETGELEEQQ